MGLSKTFPSNRQRSAESLLEC